jgi:hypothetical protein
MKFYSMAMHKLDNNGDFETISEYDQYVHHDHILGTTKRIPSLVNDYFEFNKRLPNCTNLIFSFARFLSTRSTTANDWSMNCLL